MSSNEDLEKMLAIAGTKSNPLVFTLKEYEGTRTLDIRKHFLDKKKDIKPTRKGIMLGVKNFNIVKNIINKNEAEIKDWLEGEIETHEWVSKHEKILKKAREEKRFYSQKFSVRGERWKSPVFCECAAKGGKDEIALNEEHAFFQKLNKILEKCDKTTRDEIKNCIYSVLISYFRAKNLLVGIGKSEPEDIFEILEFNWGNFLKNYLKD